MREAIYAHRYESGTTQVDQKKFMSNHVNYRGTLRDLYKLVLKFQAGCVTYYSKNGTLRLAADLVKWNDWDSSLKEIETQDAAFSTVYAILKDTMQQEEYEAMYTRHIENLKSIGSIGSDVSGLKQAVELAQADTKRKEVLAWLTSIDSSVNQNAALSECKADTGNWLLHKNVPFKEWKDDPNSLLLLHGKGKYYRQLSIMK
jgi:hypothetical protein